MVSLPEKYTLPNQPLCIELVELYFDYVHDKFHSLFHRPSLIDDIRRGATPEILIYGILACLLPGPSRLANLTRVDSQITLPLPRQTLEKEEKAMQKNVSNCST